MVPVIPVANICAQYVPWYDPADISLSTWEKKLGPLLMVRCFNKLKQLGQERKGLFVFLKEVELKSQGQIIQDCPQACSLFAIMWTINIIIGAIPYSAQIVAFAV